MAVERDGSGVAGAEDATYSVAEAARRLGVTESALRQRLRRGLLAAVPSTGGRIRVSAASVEQERSLLLERIDADGAGEEVAALRARVSQLETRLDELTSDKARLQAAFESLLTAEAALHDTIGQLVAEQRVNS